MKKPALDIEINRKPDRESVSAFAILSPYIYPYKWRLAAACGALFMICIALLSLGRGLAFIVDKGLSRGVPSFLAKQL